MNRRTVLVALLFLCSLATAGVIVARVHPAQYKQGFTLRITQAVSPPNGGGQNVFATSIRYQKSDGSWRKDTTYSDGRTTIAFSQPGRGVFDVDEKNQRLDKLAEAPGHALITA